MRLLKTTGFVVALLLVALLVMAGMGARLPQDHTASASVVVPAPQNAVWQLIDDNAAQPSWRKGLKSVTPLPPRSFHRCWQENTSMGKVPLCEVDADPPNLRVVQIADPTLPFGGEWTYQLTPVNAGSTRLTITEHGTTGPVLWRFLGHYVFHEDTTVQQYERDLQQRVAAHP